MVKWHLYPPDPTAARTIKELSTGPSIMQPQPTQSFIFWTTPKDMTAVDAYCLIKLSHEHNLNIICLSWAASPLWAGVECFITGLQLLFPGIISLIFPRKQVNSNTRRNTILILKHRLIDHESIFLLPVLHKDCLVAYHKTALPAREPLLHVSLFLLMSWQCMGLTLFDGESVSAFLKSMGTMLGGVVMLSSALDAWPVCTLLFSVFFLSQHCCWFQHQDSGDCNLENLSLHVWIWHGL